MQTILWEEYCFLQVYLYLEDWQRNELTLLRVSKTARRATRREMGLDLPYPESVSHSTEVSDFLNDYVLSRLSHADDILQIDKHRCGLIQTLRFFRRWILHTQRVPIRFYKELKNRQSDIVRFYSNLSHQQMWLVAVYHYARVSSVSSQKELSSVSVRMFYQ
jgi:hypothetical protein